MCAPLVVVHTFRIFFFFFVAYHPFACKMSPLFTCTTHKHICMYVQYGICALPLLNICCLLNAHCLQLFISLCRIRSYFGSPLFLIYSFQFRTLGSFQLLWNYLCLCRQQQEETHLILTPLVYATPSLLPAPLSAAYDCMSA